MLSLPCSYELLWRIMHCTLFKECLHPDYKQRLKLRAVADFLCDFFYLKSVSNCPSDVSEQAAITEHAFFQLF
jgi:hypothetical protein